MCALVRKICCTRWEPRGLLMGYKSTRKDISPIRSRCLFFRFYQRKRISTPFYNLGGCFCSGMMTSTPFCKNTGCLVYCSLIEILIDPTKSMHLHLALQWYFEREPFSLEFSLERSLD